MQRLPRVTLLSSRRNSLLTLCPFRPRATPGSSPQRKTFLQVFAFVSNPAYFVSSLTETKPLNLSRPLYAFSIQKSPSSFVVQPFMPLSLHCQSHLHLLSVSPSPFRTPYQPPLCSGPEDTSFAVDAKNKIQVLDSILDLGAAEKEQRAAFIVSNSPLSIGFSFPRSSSCSAMSESSLSGPTLSTTSFLPSSTSTLVSSSSYGNSDPVYQLLPPSPVPPSLPPSPARPSQTRNFLTSNSRRKACMPLRPMSSALPRTRNSNRALNPPPDLLVFSLRSTLASLPPSQPVNSLPHRVQSTLLT